MRRVVPEAFILVGGHAAAAFPGPLEAPEIDAICVDDGEEVVPAVADALGGRPAARRGARAAAQDAGWLDLDAAARGAHRASTSAAARRATSSSATATATTACSSSPSGWSRRRAAAPSAATSARSGSSTAGRSASARSAPSWTTSRRSGDSVFIADDLFWNHPERSRELARGAEGRRGVRKRWILVQTRTDLVCRQRRAARGVAADREGFRHLLRPRGGLGRGPRERHEGHGRRGLHRGGADLARTGLRRHRQLPRGPRLGRGAVSRSSGTSSRRTASSARATRS